MAVSSMLSGSPIQSCNCVAAACRTDNTSAWSTADHFTGLCAWDRLMSFMCLLFGRRHENIAATSPTFESYHSLHGENFSMRRFSGIVTHRSSVRWEESNTFPT